ncbi:MAG: hypothetical protein LUE29_01195 [Lachnospiraceae bacterium]|nr:hypothetical protein [Lachnospiraceae bacterium]
MNMNYPVYVDVTDSRKFEIPLREVKRYLGYGRVEMTPEVAGLARELIEEARKIMRPRACYTRLAVTFMDYPRMDFGFGIVESRNLWKNLSDGSLYDYTAPALEVSSESPLPNSSTSSDESPDVSDVSPNNLFSVTETSLRQPSSVTEASFKQPSHVTGIPTERQISVSQQPVIPLVRECFLLAATVGPQMDVLIRRYARTSPSKSVILQAVGAAAIEAYCDLLEVRMSAEVADEGLTLLPRFSPGYGDFSLNHQRDFFRVLDPPRRAGITLTDRLLMVPEKSVTAVIGLAGPDTGAACLPDRDASKNRCDACLNKNCGYRV